MSIQSQGNISINCPVSLSIGGGSVSIKASPDLSIEAAVAKLQGALVNIQGFPVRLNGGSKPVARTGDMTMPSPTPGAPSITGPGCPTVLA